MGKIKTKQEALCVPTKLCIPAIVYMLKAVEKVEDTIKPTSLHMSATYNMQNEGTRKLARKQGTPSFAHKMASANEEGIPLNDRELDSDSDDSEDDSQRPAELPYNRTLNTITEDDEAPNTGFTDAIPYKPPKRCRDPHFAGHPICHGRQKTTSHCSNGGDAREDLQLRFAALHDGGDSVAYYRDWRILKWEHGQTMVHGQSTLRNEVTTGKEEGERCAGSSVSIEELEKVCGSRLTSITGTNRL